MSRPRTAAEQAAWDRRLDELLAKSAPMTPARREKVVRLLAATPDHEPAPAEERAA